MLFDSNIPNLTELERLAALNAGYEQYDEQPLSADDEAIVRACLDDESEAVRMLGAEILLDQGPLTWDDFQSWLASPLQAVREHAVMSATLTTTTAVGELCASDKERCAALLAESWRQNPDDSTQVDITMLAIDEEGWLDPTWRAMESLFDQGDDQIKGALTYGYFENAITHFQMGPDDTHIHPWIEGADSARKWVLLEIARWLDLREDFLKNIAAALAEDSDPEIADAAKQMLG
jgi:hypothetical protein